MLASYLDIPPKDSGIRPPRVFGYRDEDNSPDDCSGAPEHAGRAGLGGKCDREDTVVGHREPRQVGSEAPAGEPECGEDAASDRGRS